MIKMISASKKYDDETIDNLNFEIAMGESVVITSKNVARTSLLLKVLSGLYKLDSGECTINNKIVNGITNDIFYYAPSLIHRDCDTIFDLMTHYSLYYDNYDRFLVEEMLNSINIRIHTKLDSLSISMKKFVYFTAAICSNATYLFLDSILEDVDTNTIKIMKKYLHKHNNRCFVMSGLELNRFDEVVTHIGIYKTELKFHSVHLFDKYSKFAITYYDEVDLEDFKKYKLKYIKAVQRCATVIAANNSSTRNFFIDSEPIQYDKIELELNDIFYCIGDDL